MEVSGKKASKARRKRSAKRNDTLCEPCHDINVTKSANGICQECKEHMCNTCFQHHLKARQCRNHVLMNVDDSSVPSDRDGEIEKCKKHGKEVIKYYCRKHNVVGCGDCMISGHGACKPEFIQDLLKENDEFKNLIRKMEKMASAIKESEKKIQGGKRDVISMHDQAIKELREFRTDINEYFDSAEKELNYLKSKNETILTKLEQDCKLISTDLSEVQKDTNAETFSGKSLFIHTVECKPKVLASENAIRHLQEESNLEKITFLPDKRFIGIIAHKLKLNPADFQIPAFVGTKEDSKKMGYTKAGQEGKKDKITCKTEEIKSKTVSSGACARPLPSEKPTDEQMSLHGYSGVDADHIVKSKIKQVMMSTGCFQDKAEIMLFDNAWDVNTTINQIASGTVDLREWRETRRRKKRTPIPFDCLLKDDLDF